MTYVIAQPCVDVKDKACIDECPVDCIYEGERALYIHPSECVDCGACDPVCPVEAIYYSDDVPDEWADYVRANVEFFEELGSPQGASALGNLGRDHRGGDGRAGGGPLTGAGAPIRHEWPPRTIHPSRMAAKHHRLAAIRVQSFT